MSARNPYPFVLKWFAQHMPDAQPELHFRNAFELLVAVILSAQCTDKRVNEVTPKLFAAFPSPQSMAQASLAEIGAYIQSVSYPNSKARYLKETVSMLVADFSGEVPDTSEALQKLPGVGRKTANVVLAVWFGKAAMPDRKSVV